MNVDHKRGEMLVSDPKADKGEVPKSYTFDFTYEPDCKQEDVYNETAYPIVESVLEGYNGK